MASAELAVLDGRYQVLRRLGGPAAMPLMLASDLRRGTVVCLRLRRFTTAMARLAAVPPLTSAPATGGAGPLLPFDFGVDGDVAYVVRDYVAAVSLDQRLRSAPPLPPSALVAIIRQAGQALLDAEAQGFVHPGVDARHVLITTSGGVRLAGYDALPARGSAGRAIDGSTALALLLQQALSETDAATLPPPLRRFLDEVATWDRRRAPPLPTFVRALGRLEASLAGRPRGAGTLHGTARALQAVGRRLGRLGPLLQPYVVALALLGGTGAVTAAAISATSRPGHVTVYSVPAAGAVQAQVQPTSAPEKPSPSGASPTAPPLAALETSSNADLPSASNAAAQVGTADGHASDPATAPPIATTGTSDPARTTAEPLLVPAPARAQPTADAANLGDHSPPAQRAVSQSVSDRVAENSGPRRPVTRATSGRAGSTASERAVVSARSQEARLPATAPSTTIRRTVEVSTSSRASTRATAPAAVPARVTTARVTATATASGVARR